MPDTLHAQMVQMVREDFLALVLGIVISTSGIAALAVYLFRIRQKSQLLLWLGWLALLYGVRVLVRTPTAELLVDVPDVYWVFAERFISNFILIPALLFVEQLYGKGWRNSMRMLLWFAVVSGTAATVVELVQRRATAAPDEGTVVLIPVAIVVLIGYLAGYRPAPLANMRTLVFGISVFLLLVLNEHLVINGLLPWDTRLETVGFFILICSMAYVAMLQFFQNEQNLLNLEEEMRSATRIQTSILPREVPQLTGAKICVRYLPMTAVAGDFYEFIQLDAKHIGIALADVAGHGVSAALVASMVKVAIDSQSAFVTDPPALMAGLNDIMCRQARGKLITAGYLFLDLEQGRAFYSAAAHPPVLIRRRPTQSLLSLDETGLILGVRPGEKYGLMSVDLLPGDRMVLYTDGIAEAVNAEDMMFSEMRFQQVLHAHDASGTECFADQLLTEVREWSDFRNKGQADDMTLLVIDIDLAEARAV